MMSQDEFYKEADIMRAKVEHTMTRARYWLDNHKCLNNTVIASLILADVAQVAEQARELMNTMNEQEGGGL